MVKCCVNSIVQGSVSTFFRMTVPWVRDGFKNLCSLNGKLMFLQRSDIESKVLWRSRGKLRMVVKVERGGSWVGGGPSVRGGRPPAGCREGRSRLLFILKTKSTPILTVN